MSEQQIAHRGEGRPPKPLTRLTVVARQDLHPEMVRLWFSHEGFEPIPASDAYVKLLFDQDGPLTAAPVEGERPTTRTYTVRALDPAHQTIALDFVVHGEQGLAGPWAARALPGEQVFARGPGGAWAPRPEADFHLFVGDESAAPAIAAGLERLGDDARGLVIIETHRHRLELPDRAGVEVRWLVRGDDDYREDRLAEAVAALPWDELGDVSVFAHGERGAMKALRRVLAPRELPRDRVSLSGYWASGRAEDQFQAEKRTAVGAV